MTDLMLTAPELILSIGAIILMLVAAWRGDNATLAISWAAVLLIAVAAFFVITIPYGVGFNGLYRGDAFAAFAKLLIYGATAVSIIIAPRFFASGDRLRAEYPILILFATAGAGMMVSAGDLITLYIGIELQSLADRKSVV